MLKLILIETEKYVTLILLKTILSTIGVWLPDLVQYSLYLNKLNNCFLENDILMLKKYSYKK